MALSPTAMAFVSSIMVYATGCVALPALVALVADQAASNESGALLGSLQSLQELLAAIAYPTYSRVLAWGISDAHKMIGPSAPFFIAAGILAIALMVSRVVLDTREIDDELANHKPS